MLLAPNLVLTLARQTLPKQLEAILKVFVLNTLKEPVDPVHPAGARLLLSEQKAAVFKRYPFTIILKEGQPIERNLKS